MRLPGRCSSRKERRSNGHSRNRSHGMSSRIRLPLPGDRELVDQGTSTASIRGGSGSAARQDTLAETFLTDSSKRGNEVGQEPDRIVVSFVQRHPGDGVPVARTASNHSFKRVVFRSRRGRREGLACARISYQALDQARSCYQLRTHLGGVAVWSIRAGPTRGYLTFLLLTLQTTTVAFMLVAQPAR